MKEKKYLLNKKKIFKRPFDQTFIFSLMILTDKQCGTILLMILLYLKNFGINISNDYEDIIQKNV